MDLTLAISGGLSALGYYFIKDGKVPREQEYIRTSIVKNEEPTGTNIYNSVHSRETQNDFFEKLNKRFEASKDPHKSNLFSNLVSFTTNIDTYNHTKKENYKNEFTNKVSVSPLFQKESYLNILNNPEQTLTGKPMEMSHTNMQPYFRGIQPKGNFKEYGGERKLEALTGVSKLYQNKEEVPNLFEPQRTKFNREHYMVDREAIFNSVSNKKPFVDPYPKIDVTPFPAASMRPVYKNVDELRKYNRLSAEGRFNTPAVKTKLVKSNGEETAQTRKQASEGRFSAAKHNQRHQAARGLHTQERDDLVIPFDDNFLNTPNYKTRVINTASKNTQNISNVDVREFSEGFGNIKTKRRIRAPVDDVTNLRITERGDTEQEMYTPVYNGKRQGVIHSYKEPKATLKQGNLYQHSSNPHSKRGGVVSTGFKDSTFKSSRDTVGDTHDYFIHSNIGAKIKTGTSNDRLNDAVNYEHINNPDGKQRFINNKSSNKLRDSIENRDLADDLKQDAVDLNKQIQDNPFFIRKY